jgi:Dolichyl-phosphate-mannose-protein mannosyltransferase
MGAAIVALALGIAVVAFQPLASPWWTDAGADTGYTASGIDLMAGQHSLYLQQPGMPLQDVMAMTTEARYIAHKLTSEHETPQTYASQRLLHLDDTRIFSRGYAVLFFALGALLAFLVLWRLLGSPWLGTAGAVLFLCAPGLPAMSIQFAPDVLLAGLVLAVGYLIVRAAERRDAWLYTVAALLLGLTATVKVHAAGLLVPFMLALLMRPPEAHGFTEDGLRWLRRYRAPVVGFLAIWVLFCATFDRTRVPFHTTHAEAATLQGIGLFALAYAALVGIVAWTPPLRRLSRGPLRPLGLALVAAFAAGVLLPGTLVINDLPAMLVAMGRALGHGGVGQSAPGASWSELAHSPLLQAVIVLCLSGVAGGIGFVTREIAPLLWFAGAAAMFVMATTHIGPAATFAPAFVLCIPAVLWLARLLPRPALPLAALAVVAAMLVPTLQAISKPADAARLQEQRWAAIDVLGEKLVTRPSTIALTEDSAPIPDVRWHDFVQQTVAWTPDYPYRFLPDSPPGVNTASHRHLVPVYYIGALPAGLDHAQTISIQFGSYATRPAPVGSAASLGIGAGRLVSGPGIDRPYEHPDAQYDQETGYYKDPSGSYWDLWGNPIENPPRRSSG